MQILALARKWRPRNFSQLVGQTHVVEALTHALAQQRLHHAYLFSGTRGVGKTTLGRVFAKALNCEQGITPEPCGECDACRAIDEGRFVDLIEIDAASRTKVEDTRELLDNVQYLPAQGRFKIYLIDEVHMLSQSSFNALLKTLEEPPEHVKFILATTEPHKLPITVLSRCLKFNLQRLQPALIAEHLRRVAEAEGFTITDGALHLLAHHADGSVRDALSLLDQAVVQGSGQVDEATVRDMLGLASEAALTALLEALADRDAQALADVLAQLAQEGADYPLLLEALAEQFHRMALLQLLGSAAPDQDISLADTFARRFDPVRVQQCYQTALLGQKELQWAPSARVAFEMAAMRMLAFEPLTSAKKPAPQFEKTPTQAQNAPQSGKKPAAPPAAEPASGKNGGGPVSEPPLDTAPLVEAPTGEAALAGEAKQSVFSQLRARIQGGATPGKPTPPTQAASQTDRNASARPADASTSPVAPDMAVPSTAETTVSAGRDVVPPPADDLPPWETEPLPVAAPQTTEGSQNPKNPAWDGEMPVASAADEAAPGKNGGGPVSEPAEPPVGAGAAGKADTAEAKSDVEVPDVAQSLQNASLGGEMPVVPAADAAAPGKNGGDPVSGLSAAPGQAAHADVQPAAVAAEEARPDTDAGWLSPEAWLAQIDELGLEGLTRELALNCVADHHGARWQVAVAPGSEHLWAQRGAALVKALGQAEQVSWPQGACTPATWLREEAERRRAELKAAFVSDPVVQALRQRFDARIIESSIQPSDNRE